MGQCESILQAADDHELVVGDRGSRFEFRYPAATTNFDTIRRNVAFIYFARDFLNMKIRKGLQVENTLSGTFGEREAVAKELVDYIKRQRPSHNRTLVLGALDASTNRN